MDVFETEAERYDRWFDRHPVLYEAELEAVRALSPVPRVRGLEIGVGTGRFATPLGIVEGVEPASAMRRMAAGRGIRTVGGVAEALPFVGRSFGLSLMVTTICFVTDPARSCREAWRVLQPGGRFVVGLVDRESFLGAAYESRRAESPFYRNARFFGVGDVAQLMAAAGFGDLRFRQTLFRDPNETRLSGRVVPGHGQGGFAVVAGVKRA